MSNKQEVVKTLDILKKKRIKNPLTDIHASRGYEIEMYTKP